MSTDHDFAPPESDPMTVDPTNLGSVDPLSVEGIFLVALGKQGSERDKFLSSQCSDIPQRQKVEALLAAYEQAGNFLEKPAVAAEPTPVGQYLTPCDVPGAIGKLGQYEILEEIGRGGMGVVFRAHDPKLQRIVAVKALAPELARLPVARQRFLREARAAAAISHPHVVTIFAVDGTEEASLGTERATLPYLVMECIVGQTLHDKIKRVGALKTEEIVRISRQMAEGLAAAHKRGLIHRDIKPANILLENGVERVKITDFGLARTTSDGGITHTGEILGTPQCMSPEQARGELVDQRSDLFSMGCVMYTMCTGVNPFRADNMLAVMKKVCESDPRPVAQLNPNIPQWLCSLVHQLLEKQPERRIPTAGEVVEALEARTIPMAGVEPSQIESSLLEMLEGIWTCWTPDVIIASVASGMIAASMPDNAMIAPVLTLFFVAWPVLLYAKWQGRCRWPWVSWPLGVASLVSLYLGVMLTVWVRMETHYGPGLFVFGLAAGIFCLLTRWFPQLFSATSRSQTERPLEHATVQRQMPEAPLARFRIDWILVALFLIALGTGALNASRAGPERVTWGIVLWVLVFCVWLTMRIFEWGARLLRGIETKQVRGVSPTSSPWSVLGWMLVGLLGFGLIGGLLLAVAIVIPAYQASQTKSVELGRIVLETHGQKIAKVTVDGHEVNTLETNIDPQGRPSFLTNAGPCTLRIDYVSDNPLEEKFFHSTVVVSATKVIDATPSVRPIVVPLANKPIEGNVIYSQTSPGTTSPSIPLADAVEVLADVEEMPVPSQATSGGLLSKASDVKHFVWIDEPGLLIRMKRLDFEGSESKGDEYYAKHSWGTGPLLLSGDAIEHPAELQAGRYSVLVQDLDYGWGQDRRGMLTIGNGPICLLVRRSFESERLASSGAQQFPIPFRWAGKTYQIYTPNEVQLVNLLLSLLSEGSTTNGIGSDSPMFAEVQAFQDRTFVKEAIETSSEGSLRLSRTQTSLTLNVQTPGITCHVGTEFGLIAWKGAMSSPRTFHVAGRAPVGTVFDKMLGWDGQSAFHEFALVPANSTENPIVIRRDRAAIKRFSEQYVTNRNQPLPLQWFGESGQLLHERLPIARRLIAAWAEGYPDVPETELLQLGQVNSIDELWMARQYKPEETLKALVIPGSTPGTWRIKEPPEGAVTP